ncbi:lamin tail domain-containing protein [Sorangium sp. So ce1036]|uniref:lamin tail domain-containing protein n=1 Tax=Sorangium sp. So ce1036 TaxID=3133328 RepID=UPI003F0D4A25
MTYLRFTVFCAALLYAGGCGSGDESGDGGGPDTDATTTSQGSSGSGSGGGTAAGGGATTTVVVNEISAKGSDWIELGNPGPGSADLGGFGLCDSDEATGACNLGDALWFPVGTQLAAGEYLLVLGDQVAEDGPGPHTTCLPEGGPSRCFYATWKVSASRGETVYLISPDGEVLTRLEYPIEAAAEGQTWARLPDMTGEPAATAPTPGAENAAP